MSFPLLVTKKCVIPKVEILVLEKVMLRVTLAVMVRACRTRRKAIDHIRFLGIGLELQLATEANAGSLFSQMQMSLISF